MLHMISFAEWGTSCSWIFIRVKVNLRQPSMQCCQILYSKIYGATYRIWFWWDWDQMLLRADNSLWSDCADFAVVWFSMAILKVKLNTSWSHGKTMMLSHLRFNTVAQAVDQTLTKQGHPFLLLSLRTSLIWATSWENLFMPYVNNKDADQPAHPCSLISAFIVHCLDSIILLLARAEI